MPEGALSRRRVTSPGHRTFARPPRVAAVDDCAAALPFATMGSERLAGSGGDMRGWSKGVLLGLGLAVAVGASRPAAAIGLIRDAEIETTIHELADPVFGAAGLDVGSIDIYLVRDDVLNAFVAGGQNLFINTGLLQHTGDPEQLRGVIAHETGHIAGGHLARMNTAIENAAVQTLIGTALGALAAFAGAPQLGQAVMLGGATVAQQGFLKFSRGQEESADQAAVTYLARIGRSPKGLIDFFNVLEQQNVGAAGAAGVFLRTHPLTRDRILVLQDELARSPYRNRGPDPAEVAAHARMVAKLDGFLGNPQQVLRRYASDSLTDRYARAIAYYRIPDLDRALATVDGLIAEHPDDPWFLELKGQMLFENGRTREAIEPYREAVRARPGAALLRLGLARALLEQNDPKADAEAAALLQETVRLEPRNAGAWRFLGIAYGKLGNEGAASLALAEQAVLMGNREDAMLYLNRAGQRVKPGDPEWYRLEDLRRAAEELPTRREREQRGVRR
jgi:predicted Zn-dependent protease